jgi:acyl-CoA hydrolase
VGELLTFLASVNYTGTSSIEVGIKVIAENILTKVVRHVNSCFLTMVAMDENRKPIAVPKFAPVTPDEKRRYEGALLRREMRKEFEQKFTAIRANNNA